MATAAKARKDEAPEVEEESIPLADELNHLRDCPAQRLESFEAIRPARPARGRPAMRMQVTRCIECGEAVTRKIGPVEEPDEED